MAKKKPVKWHRDLTQFEKRVDYVQLNEKWDTAEESYVDSLIPVIKQIRDKLFIDITRILKAGNYIELPNIKIGYHDKVVNIIKQQLFDAYRMGKQQAYDEFKKDKKVVLTTEDREYFTVKAETVTLDLFSKIKTQTIFIVLAGVRAEKNTSQIMADLKGIDYGEER